MSALGVVVIEPLAVLSVLNTVQSLVLVFMAALVPNHSLREIATTILVRSVPGKPALGVLVPEPVVLTAHNTVQSLARVQQAVLVPHLRAPKAVPTLPVHLAPGKLVLGVLVPERVVPLVHKHVQSLAQVSTAVLAPSLRAPKAVPTLPVHLAPGKLVLGVLVPERVVPLVHKHVQSLAQVSTAVLAQPLQAPKAVPAPPVHQLSTSVPKFCLAQQATRVHRFTSLQLMI